MEPQLSPNPAQLLAVFIQVCIRCLSLTRPGTSVITWPGLFEVWGGFLGSGTLNVPTGVIPGTPG